MYYSPQRSAQSKTAWKTSRTFRFLLLLGYVSVIALVITVLRKDINLEYLSAAGMLVSTIGTGIARIAASKKNPDVYQAELNKQYALPINQPLTKKQILIIVLSIIAVMVILVKLSFIFAPVPH